MVTARVYDAGNRFKDYFDRFTLYLPVPKELREREGVRGVYLGFSFSEDGDIIKGCWDSNTHYIVNSTDLYLGRKMNRAKLPAKVQEWVNKYEKAWNDAVMYDNGEAWERFNNL